MSFSQMQFHNGLFSMNQPTVNALLESYGNLFDTSDGMNIMSDICSLTIQVLNSRKKFEEDPFEFISQYTASIGKIVDKMLSLTTLYGSDSSNDKWGKAIRLINTGMSDVIKDILINDKELRREGLAVLPVHHEEISLFRDSFELSRIKMGDTKFSIFDLSGKRSRKDVNILNGRDYYTVNEIVKTGFTEIIDFLEHFSKKDSFVKHCKKENWGINLIDVIKERSNEARIEIASGECSATPIEILTSVNRLKQDLITVSKNVYEEELDIESIEHVLASADYLLLNQVFVFILIMGNIINNKNFLNAATLAVENRKEEIVRFTKSL
jgi:hypothetical protein